MIGRDLGIIGNQDSTTHLVPEFTPVTDRGPTIERAKITFTKYGHDGVAVESRVNGGMWIEIDIAMVKPWDDEREDYKPVQRVTIGP